MAASAGVARLALLAHIATHALPPALVYRLELVLEEALMNRQWHAWPAGGQHTALTVRVTADAVEMCFEDDGVASIRCKSRPRRGRPRWMTRYPAAWA